MPCRPYPVKKGDAKMMKSSTESAWLGTMAQPPLGEEQASTVQELSRNVSRKSSGAAMVLVPGPGQKQRLHENRAVCESVEIIRILDDQTSAMFSRILARDELVCDGLLGNALAHIGDDEG